MGFRLEGGRKYITSGIGHLEREIAGFEEEGEIWLLEREIWL